MPEIKLTGLKAGLPIGFMAALGTFRHALEMHELGGAKLGWTPYAGQWCACLNTGKVIDAEELARLFAARVKAVEGRPEFEWSEAVKGTPREKFRLASEAALDFGFADWFQAFGSELATTKEGDIESTPFDMTVARQLFLADASWLTKSLATPDKKHGDALNIESFRQALFGPWEYQDNQHSLGWDASTVLMGAFTPKAPTAMSKAGVKAAVWLAMESLPFFPCFYANGLATVGFQRERRKETFRWPVWIPPLSIGATRMLLAHSVGLELNTLSGRGVAAIYSSTVFKPNKYLTSFQPGVLET